MEQMYWKIQSAIAKKFKDFGYFSFCKGRKQRGKVDSTSSPKGIDGLSKQKRE